MIAGEALAQYGDAIAVGSELCDALLTIARGPEFAGSDHGHIGVKATWAFKVEDQAVTIIKRGSSLDPDRIQYSLAESGGTQIIVTGEDIPGMDQDFDTRTMPELLQYSNIGVSRPSDFRELYRGDVPVGDGGLTLGGLLGRAVELDPHRLGLFLNGMVPGMTSASIRLAHFGDTAEGLGEFSATAVMRKAVLEDRRRVVSRAFTLQLLAAPENVVVFETFDPTITTKDMGNVSGEPMLSIRGSRYGNRAKKARNRSATMTSSEMLIPQTVGEIDELRGIGLGVISYVSGYARGYADRFETSESGTHSDELSAKGYEAGRYLAIPKPRPARFAFGAFGL